MTVVCFCRWDHERAGASREDGVVGESPERAPFILRYHNHFRYLSSPMYGVPSCLWRLLRGERSRGLSVDLTSKLGNLVTLQLSAQYPTGNS